MTLWLIAPIKFILSPLILIVKALLMLFFVRQKRDAKTVFILTKAMAPLTNGRWPNGIFAGRLERALTLYRQYQNEGREPIVLVMCPLHRTGETIDKIPLWQAAKNYLMEHGVPEEKIRVIKDECFNGQAEIDLAVRSWRTHEMLGKKAHLIIISASYVKLRSWLCCIWLMRWPEFIWIKEKTTRKTWLEELVLTIYSVVDPLWRAPSLFGWWTWKTRHTEEGR